LGKLLAIQFSIVNWSRPTKAELQF